MTMNTPVEAAIDSKTLQSGSLPREEIPSRDKWNVEALYKNFNAWKKDFEEWGQPASSAWVGFTQYKGKLSEGPEKIKACLEQYLLVKRNLSKIYVYTHLNHDVDISEPEAKTAHDRALTSIRDFEEISSWFVPEILSQQDAYLHKCLSSESLAPYKVFLETIIRLKPHVLSADQEAIMSLSGNSIEGSEMDEARKIFSSFLNADLTFQPALDSQGKPHHVSLGTYSKLLNSTDRVLRENAFLRVHEKFLEFENSLCEMLSAHVQKHYFVAKARKYTSCLEAALYQYQIDTGVYHNLIQTVKENLPVLHKYMALRKKILGVQELHCYDLYVPLVEGVEFPLSYEKAEEMVIESAGFLGQTYQNDLKKGLLQERWVDRYENQQKRSGAYSSGCFDSMPYILMNYHGTLRDVFTLCHESGHSMHTLLSHRHQPFQYADYPIFVAEVASTFLEEVLMRHLTKKAESPKHKAYLINQKIEDIRATLFRQTLFAEFELLIHNLVEKGTPLTPDLLKKEYHRLYAEYYGENLIVDAQVDIEWARIPHFYSNFYVYQYATGISAALSLVNRIEKEGDKAKEAYLQFLSSGSSKFPLELLKIAGVDMTKKDPIQDAVDYFGKLVEELEALTDELKKD